MTTLREAAKLALEALEHIMNYSSPHGLATVTLTLRKALAAQDKQAVYVQPPRREWQELTHEERDEICKDFVGDDGRVGAYLSLALEVEVRLTEKNRSEV